MIRLPVIRTNPAPVMRDITSNTLHCRVNGRRYVTPVGTIHTFDHEYEFMHKRKVVECVSADEMMRVGAPA